MDIESKYLAAKWLFKLLNEEGACGKSYIMINTSIIRHFHMYK
jgi:hypothetical protein